MQLLVTRPREQADDWVQRLRQHGVAAAALPLIDIAAVDDDSALRAAWAGLAVHRLVMFVSANAVAGFFAARPPAAAWPAQTLAGCTGPGTSAALRAHRLPEAAIVEPRRTAVKFDSEALWRLLAPREWKGESALIVRGEDGRDWLADQLTARGANVAFLEAYRRGPPRLTGDEQTRLREALAAPLQSVWLFSSSQAVDYLGQLVPGADWSSAQAWATHARIAQAAQTLGFHKVLTLSPTVSAVVAEWGRSIQSPPTSAQRR